jgi:hypothetical protein
MPNLRRGVFYNSATIAGLSIEELIGLTDPHGVETNPGGGGGDPDPDPNPSSEIAYTLNEFEAGSGHTISNGRQTLANTSGGNDYQWWVPATDRFPRDDQIYYWEVECGGFNGAFNGYIGVATQEAIDDNNETQNPISFGSVGYRGNGTVWQDNNQRTGNYSVYTSGTIIMLAFQPSTGFFWHGTNGTWGEDPAGVTGKYAASPTDTYYPQLQTRDAGAIVTLKTLTADLTYPVPPNCIALGAAVFEEPEAPADPDAHRYWRIYNTVAKAQGWSGVSIAELELYDGIGGPNLTGLGTPISGSNYVTEPASGAFDGDKTSAGWSGAQDSAALYQTSWLGYDFGAGTEYNIKQYEISVNPASPDSGPYKWRFEYSDDGTTWTSTSTWEIDPNPWTAGDASRKFIVPQPSGPVGPVG